MNKHPESEDSTEPTVSDASLPDTEPTSDDELAEVAGGAFNSANVGVFNSIGVFNTANYEGSTATFTVTVDRRFDKLIR
jgi:hypothetical protein